MATAATHRDWDAAALLALDEAQPETLFGTGSRRHIEAVAVALWRRWHPDVCAAAEAAAVAARIGALRDAALARLQRGIWSGPGEAAWRSADGDLLRVDFLRSDRSEMGQACLCRDHLLLLADPPVEAFRQAFLRAVRSLPWAGPAMQQELEPWLPQTVSERRLDDGRGVLRLGKRRELIRLRDLQDHLGGRLDGRQVAWMVSRMLGLCCYLAFAGLTHNDIGPHSLFVDPARHGLALLDGWWYAAPAGARLLGLPRRTLEALPPWLAGGPTAEPRLDLVRVRSLALDLLGPGATTDPGVPAALLEWCFQAPEGDAFADFRAWRTRWLPACYGPPTFAELPVTAAAVYGGG